MHLTEEEKSRYAVIWNELSKHYDEKDKRLLAAAMSKSLGYGGQKVVLEITKLNADTVKLGTEQLNGIESLPDKGCRRLGGGRKPVTEIYPEIEMELLKLVEATTQGDPESPLLWTSKSLENLANGLKEKGYCISLPTVSDLLAKNGYSMQANKKRFEGSTHIDRNSQFEYINETAKRVMAEGNPVISVDGKKKENIGNFKNTGKEYAKKGNAIEVNAYDFIDKEKGKVTPYGVYDVLQNDGWVNVGTDHDTAEFSVTSIKQWWLKMGNYTYPNATELLINADSGGSNSAVSRLWKVELQKFSDEMKIPITVCHFPPGTSKWNKIEHRMFSAISMNWRGRPLVSHEVVVNLISATTNKGGLKIDCALDTNKYPKGIKVSDEELSSVNIKFHEVNSKYNYTIYPTILSI
jgi:hypothetical protein